MAIRTVNFEQYSYLNDDTPPADTPKPKPTPIAMQDPAPTPKPAPAPAMIDMGRLRKLHKKLAIAEIVLACIILLLAMIASGLGYFASHRFVIVMIINFLTSIIGLINGGLGMAACRRTAMMWPHFTASILAALIDLIELILIPVFIWAPYMAHPQVINAVDGTVIEDWRGVIGITWIEWFFLLAHLICSIESAAIVCDQYWRPKETVIMIEKLQYTTKEAKTIPAGTQSLSSDDGGPPQYPSAPLATSEHVFMEQETVIVQDAGPTPPPPVPWDGTKLKEDEEW